jgi:Leucine Rich repeats (2 copies)/Leucine Rich Repeat
MNQSDTQLLKKFQEILEMSQKVKKAEVAEYLEITEKELFKKLVSWRHLGFKLNEEYIVVENLTEFTTALDHQFEDWVQKEHEGIGKIENSSPKFSPTGNHALIPTSNKVIKKKLKLKIATQNYHGKMLVKGDYDVLMALEQQIGQKITQPAQFNRNTVGYYAHDHHVTWLSLNNLGLSSLPESLGNLKSLTNLALISNKLSTLPRSLGNLSSLEKLYLHFNQFSDLPRSLGNLSSLKDLSLNNNNLSSLSERLGDLKSLTYLDLNSNKLSTLPASLGAT